MLTHDEFVKILAEEHLRRGWIVYAANIPGYRPPPRLDSSIPNLYMIRNEKIRIIEVEPDTRAINHMLNQLKSFVKHADEVYLAIITEEEKAKSILLKRNLKFVKVITPKSFKEILKG